MQLFVSLVCGGLFGAGLAISGMTNPEKVLAFLDVSGEWDPTLATVMGGAVFVAAIGFAATRRMEQPWFAEQFAFPMRSDLDAKLISGAVCFGVGWGLVGLCPGPALANLSRGSAEATLFVLAMAFGMLLHHLGTRRSEPALVETAA